RIRAVAALSAVKEGAAREEITVLSAIANDGFVAATQRDFISTLTAQEEGLLSFASLASAEQRTKLDEKVTGAEVLRTAALEVEAAQVPLEEPLEIRAEDFSTAMGDRLAKLRGVERSLDLDVKTGLEGQRNQIGSQVVAQAIVVLLVLFVAVLVALLIARSMALSLRRLREGALAVAYESLPQSVARLRNPETLGELTPEQLAASVQDPVQVRGRDEIGQVSLAFNVVHREAVRIAAEQAALRANVATMFINLARRSQVLVDRLIGNLDRLERGEEDPDRLAQLFQLDHLATRMRRNDENLLVLAGADSSRMQREAAALSDVLRAAQSEVEQYTRIEFGIVDRDVDVAPHAVNDIVHLLAELFDNATSFSPPDTTVVVDARRAGDRTILQIEDRGIGISAEQLIELNTRLAQPPTVDVAVSRMMGLVVVGRLAARHGVRVELRAARDRGIIADVILPAGVLILPQRGRQHALGLPQSRPPLALESSPNYPPQASGHRGYGGDPRYDDPRYDDPRYDDPRYDTRQLTEQWRRSGSSAQIPESPSGIPGWGPPPIPGGPAQPPRATPRTSAGDRHDARGGAGYGSDNGAHLPRRQPGDGLTLDGEAVPSSQHPREPQPRNFSGPRTAPPGPSAPGGGRGPAGVPHAEPRHPQPAPGQRRDAGLRGGATPPAQPRPAPGRESIHSIELPMGSGPAAGSPASGRGGAPNVQPRPSGPPASANRATGASRARPRSTASSADDSALIKPNPDDTMELPIFREVESAWFRTKQPGESQAREVASDHGGPMMIDRGGAGDPDSAAGRATPTQRTGGAVGAAGGRSAGANMAPATVGSSPSAGVDPSWQGVADEGWRRASEVAAKGGSETTNAGLPKRVPMAQLVPGGVDTASASTTNRSPEGVRGLLSAYHRGVQRGRSEASGTGSGTRVSNNEEQA
ncbi:MAG: nitrate- and nitrite sensing domain-containing protein, partial [Micromonosporaceae bacterium]